MCVWCVCACVLTVGQLLISEQHHCENEITLAMDVHVETSGHLNCKDSLAAGLTNHQMS